MGDNDRISGARSAIGLVAWILVCFGAGLFGALFEPGEWYAGLDKPSWTPPNWLFGPVWTLLYIMMGAAAWLVWRQPGKQTRRALALFCVQLVLNAAWSWLFFGLHLPAVAMVEILLLSLAIAATIVAFQPLSRTAAFLLLPYLLWVSFASMLNFALWRLNA